MKYLLDADTFSEMVKGINAKIVKRLDSLRTGDAGLSVITRGEIAFGVQIHSLKTPAKQRLDRLLDAIETLPLPSNAAIYYGELRAHLRRLGTPIGPNDLWIAAHARAASLILVTNNIGEFSRVPKLKLENWVA
jgi:tRNA(fMet)-specific endonuclease VapC